VIKFLETILKYREPLFRDFTLEDIQHTFLNSSVQHRWLEQMIDKLQRINFELDGLLDKPDKDRIWETLAIERRTMLRCLTMILDVRDEMESERTAQDAQNQLLQKYQGASAPLNLQ